MVVLANHVFRNGIVEVIVSAVLLSIAMFTSLEAGNIELSIIAPPIPLFAGFFGIHISYRPRVFFCYVHVFCLFCGHFLACLLLLVFAIVAEPDGNDPKCSNGTAPGEQGPAEFEMALICIMPEKAVRFFYAFQSIFWAITGFMFTSKAYTFLKYVIEMEEAVRYDKLRYQHQAHRRVKRSRPPKRIMKDAVQTRLPVKNKEFKHPLPQSFQQPSRSNVPARTVRTDSHNVSSESVGLPGSPRRKYTTEASSALSQPRSPLAPPFNQDLTGASVSRMKKKTTETSLGIDRLGVAMKQNRIQGSSTPSHGAYTEMG